MTTTKKGLINRVKINNKPWGYPDCNTMFAKIYDALKHTDTCSIAKHSGCGLQINIETLQNTSIYPKPANCRPAK